MNAIIYLYISSLKNRVHGGIRSPKRLIKFLGLAFVFLLFIAGAANGVVGSVSPTEMPPPMLKGTMFILFLIPYYGGRHGSIGPFGTEYMNFVFTAPIMPRTVLLAELVRRLGDMLIISLAIMTVFAFMSMNVVIEINHMFLAGLFCFVLTVVCKLFGMYLFVEYRKAYRWAGFFWIALLLIAAIFHLARAGWEWLPGIYDFLDSHIFALTPLVGWAAAGAFAFMMGQTVAGVLYTGLLVAAGAYFSWVIYRSAPDFYDEALGMPVIADTDNISTGAIAGNITNSNSNFCGDGAAAFFDKHLLEESGVWSSKTRIPWLKDSRAGAILETVGIGIFGGMALAVIWGLYARGFAGDIELAAMLFRTIGVPSGNILAVLIPSVLVLAAYPQYDKGFMELYNPYFYLVPDSPIRKLLWVSMARIVKVCAVAILVLGLAGAVSGTSPVIVLGAMLAYIASAFMVLGLRLAVVRVLGVVSGGRQKLVATLPVMVFVLVGVIGMLAIFYFGPESWGLTVALLGFAGWCGLAGMLGFGFSLRVLHDVDAPL